jgi:hypothetical protein
MKRYTTDAQDRARRRDGMAYEIRSAIRPDPRRIDWHAEVQDGLWATVAGVVFLALVSAALCVAAAHGWFSA